jgi:hypothetical protein
MPSIPVPPPAVQNLVQPLAGRERFFSADGFTMKGGGRYVYRHALRAEPIEVAYVAVEAAPERGRTCQRPVFEIPIGSGRVWTKRGIEGRLVTFGLVRNERRFITAHKVVILNVNHGVHHASAVSGIP